MALSFSSSRRFAASAASAVRSPFASSSGAATRSLHAAVIVSTARTPIGSFNGALSSMHATDLGAAAIAEAVKRAGVPADAVNEVYMGSVLQGGLGQAPARQAALKAGLSHKVPCTAVNKVCASGMKALAMGAHTIQLGLNDVVVAGGMESMSQAPFFVKGARQGLGYGHSKFLHLMQHDGLWDAFDDHPMGMCGEACAAQHGISREDQDAYAIESYKRSAAAWKDGRFASEVFAVSVPQRRGDPVQVAEDEEFKRVKLDKVASLRPAFKKDGTITAANASTINDGASALVLASLDFAKAQGLPVLASVVATADAARVPLEFPQAPADAIELALKRAGLSVADIDAWEINEAFANVAIVNMQLLGIPHDKLNVNGGGVSLGHPIGSSGSRIVGTLINVLEQRDGQFGCAAICNGGGGATAVIVERMAL